MTARIPKPVNAAIDWAGARLGWPRVYAFTAATAVTLAAGLAPGISVAVILWTALMTVALIAALWWRTLEIDRLTDLCDDQEREIGRLRHQNNELMRGQIAGASQMTAMLPGIKEGDR